MAHVAVTSLLRTIELEFFQSQPRPLPQPQKQIITDCTDVIKSLRGKLRSVQSSLEELQGLDAEGREKLPRDLAAKLRDFALKAEDGIESELSDIYLAEPIPAELVPPSDEPQPPSPAKLRQVLQRAVEDIDRIKEDLTSIKDNRNNKIEQAENAAAQFRHPSEPPEEIMVGKSDELKTTKDLLIPESTSNNGLEVVAVHGMGGIGKTVLAKSIYEDKSIKEHFDKCAWVVISQHHNKDQMLLRLFESLLQEQPQYDSPTIEEQIYRYLKGNRYLIVMDDVWSIDAWNDVQRCFPDDCNRSRVLLTTRLKNVAEAAAATINPKNCYQMRFFDTDESWDLFKEKKFLIEISNQEFEKIGKKVVEKCYGLPLAVVVAAGLFSKLTTLEEWKNVEKAIDSLERKPIAERCADILALSYNHLPHYLKSCFLYFGFFPKNFPLIVKNLARFWTAEGFIKEGENERVIGEKYLLELIDRNLVLVGDRKSSYGTIRTCIVHDLLHDLSIKEAQNENLLYVVGDKETTSSHSDCRRWITARKESYSDLSFYACFRNCRSFLYFEEDKEAIKLMKRGVFKQTLGPRKHILHLLQVSSHLKMIRVLEMSSFQCLHELSNWIADLVHLRYLSLIISFPLTNFPLSKARNLHTLQISAGYQGMKDPFPPFILDELPQLRYLKCWPSCELFPPSFVHENLHSVSSISPVQCLQQVFAMIPHLRKLSITGERFFFILYAENLVFLPQLESLSIDFQSINAFQTNHTPTSFVITIASLHGLKKLKLMCTEILWKDVNLLAKLPNLEALKLIFQACVGREWKLEDEYVFCSLKYLFIDYSSLVEWEARNVNFPVLEHLLLSRCFNLKEIPSDFVDITTLQSIEIIDCLTSVETSAREIEEGQREFGNDTIEVVVHERPSNSYAGTSNRNKEGASNEEEDS